MKIKNTKNIFFFIITIVNFTIVNLYAEVPVYKLTANKLIYKDNNQLLIAEGNANAKDQFGNEIFSDFIIYDKFNNIIKTRLNSKYIDLKGNNIHADIFLYDLNLKKLIAKQNVKYFDKNKNEFFFTEFEYYENSEIGYGKNFQGKPNDKSTMEGPFVTINNKTGITILQNNKKINAFKDSNRNFYTTCKKESDTMKSIKDRCTDWSITTSKTTHDSKAKMVYHNNAFINLRNIPVFYTPYFSHPDPTVRRKSGFLVPSTKNFTNLGRTIKSPYFWAIDENSDLTFTPILFQEENSILLANYRIQNNNSFLALDTSYNKGYKNINKKGKGGENLQRTAGSRNHLFAKYLGSFNDLIFRDNDIEFNLQRISQKNYLSVNQINTDYVKQDMQALNNNFIINSYDANQKIRISANIYENLSTDDKNNKYQYTIPSIEYNSFFKKHNQNVNINNNFYAKNYSGDTKQINQTNIIETESEQKIIKKIGISNTFKTKLTNINLYNDQVINEKDNFNNDFYTTFGIESSMPFARFLDKTEEILNPRLFVKYTSGKMKNSQNETKILSYSDIYSMDRMNSLSNPETGLSLGYGFDYEINKKNINNIIYMNSKFSLGQVISDQKKQEMPISSSLNEKSSNFVGNFNFFFDKEILKNKNKISIENNNIDDEINIKNGTNFNYNFNISNDLNKILKNEIQISNKYEKNLLEINYYEAHDIDNKQSIEGKFKRNFDNKINMILTAKKNLEGNYSENNSIEINYDSDCLKIGLNLSKTFYENQDLKSDNNLTLFVMLKPFGQPVAPDLTNLINSN